MQNQISRIENLKPSIVDEKKTKTQEIKHLHKHTKSEIIRHSGRVSMLCPACGILYNANE